MMAETVHSEKSGPGTRLYILFRIVGTAFIFSFISVGGFLLSITVFPLVAIFSSKDKKHLRVQKVLHYTFRFTIFMMKILRLVRLKRIDWEKIEHDSGGVLFISNHPTLIDYVYLVSIFPQLDCIVKSELWDNFFLRGVVKAAGYIKADNVTNFKEECLHRLESGRNILIFPEGTRSLPDKLRNFKKGAASLVVSSACKVQLLTIKCTPPILMKGQKWYDIPPRMATINIQAYDELHRETATKGEKKVIKAQANVNAYIWNFIDSRL